MVAGTGAKYPAMIIGAAAGVLAYFFRGRHQRSYLALLEQQGRRPITEDEISGGGAPDERKGVK